MEAETKKEINEDYIPLKWNRWGLFWAYLRQPRASLLDFVIVVAVLTAADFLLALIPW